MKYLVTVKAVYECIVEIEAKDEDEARRLADNGEGERGPLEFYGNLRYSEWPVEVKE
jgi:hypothetical protein